MGQVCEASTGEPYLAVNLYLDPAVIATILLDMNGFAEPAMGTAFGVAKAGPALLETWRRFTSLLDRPDEIAVLGPHLEHELMFRLLMGPHGTLLHQIAGADTRLSHIRRAMAWIRQHYAESLSIDAMAAVAGMGVSVFHRRFKALTDVSPLQYQKQIRLHERAAAWSSSTPKPLPWAMRLATKVRPSSRGNTKDYLAPRRRDADTLKSIVEAGP